MVNMEDVNIHYITSFTILNIAIYDMKMIMQLILMNELITSNLHKVIISPFLIKVFICYQREHSFNVWAISQIHFLIFILDRRKNVWRQNHKTVEEGQKWSTPHQTPNERIHDLGQGWTTKNIEGMPRHAQFQHL